MLTNPYAIEMDHITQSEIVRVCCEYFDLTESSLKLKIKTPERTMCRETIIYLLIKYTKLCRNYPKIAKIIDRHIATVYLTNERMQDKAKHDKEYVQMISELIDRIGLLINV